MKKYSFLLGFLILLMNAASGQSAAPDSVQTYVRMALDSMKRNSVNKHQVDWEKLYAQTLENAQKAKTIRQTYPILKKALRGLNDNHSKFAEPELIKAYEAGYRATGQSMPFPTGGMVEGKYAYLKLPDFSADNRKEQREYADSVQSLIRHLDRQNPKGWILDLRRNWGGMLAPMLAGVAPLLGDGQWLGFEDADQKVNYWQLRNGAILQGDSVLLAVSAPGYTLQKSNLPLCLLTDRNTASSGEMVAIAFLGRPNTKIIGTNTGGLTTSNDLFRLPDGAGLILTTGVSVDRTGKRYGKHLEPDVPVKNLSGLAILDESAYLQAALKFLKNSKK